MLSQRVTARPRTLEELVGPELLRRFDRLDVFSRKMFAGKLPGERRSKRRGRSVEFDDYRNYVPGDDLRHIDWNVFARLDRFFVKLFREEEDLAVRVVLDLSPSMDAGDPSKLVFASRLAMAIGYIGLVNQNRVSIAAFGGQDGGFRQLTPMRGRRNVERLSRFILQALERPVDASEGARAMDFEEAMRRVVGVGLGGRGVLVVLSDFLVRGDLSRALNYLGAGTGFDTYCLQVLAPGELEPEREAEQGFVGDLRLTDSETGHPAEITVSSALIRRYKARLEAFIARLDADCARRGITHAMVRSDTPVDALVMDYLRRRGMFR